MQRFCWGVRFLRRCSQFHELTEFNAVPLRCLRIGAGQKRYFQCLNTTKRSERWTRVSLQSLLPLVMWWMPLLNLGEYLLKVAFNSSAQRFRQVCLAKLDYIMHTRKDITDMAQVEFELENSLTLSTCTEPHYGYTAFWHLIGQLAEAQSAVLTDHGSFRWLWCRRLWLPILGGIFWRYVRDYLCEGSDVEGYGNAIPTLYTRTRIKPRRNGESDDADGPQTK